MEEDLNLFQMFKAAIKLVTDSVLDENVQQLSDDLEHWLNAITPVMIRVVRKFPLLFFSANVLRLFASLCFDRWLISVM